jgi:alkanesulfonate monooxygenase SsuD/methylene tetrahydromethanopterin reductase-like flavin-dependent oxidoreductase (luciferase family)
MKESCLLAPERGAPVSCRVEQRLADSSNYRGEEVVVSKIGVFINPEADTAIGAIVAQAQAADRQGFDSVWLGDHLIDYRGEPHIAEGPPDSFTVMVAIGALTTRVRLAWGMLNPSFRNPAVLAKMLATLDQLTRGRVICTLGAGWLQAEYDAYGLPFVDGHNERIAQEREVVQLMKELWTHPAPERVTYEGTYVQARELPFNPAPFQKPHPPIWIGGDSEPTVALVKELADGWVPLSRGQPDLVRELLATPDWPSRPMTVVRLTTIIVAETREAALPEAERAYEKVRSTATLTAPTTFEDFLEREVIGTPAEALETIRELEAAGIDYLLAAFETAEQQERAALLLLPLLA